MKKLLSFILLTITTITLTGCFTTTTKDTQMITIGLTQFADHPSLDNCRNGFIEGMKQSGYIENQNVKYEYQSAQTDMNIASSIAQNFAAKNVKLILAVATPSAQATYAVAKEKDIPLVFSAVSDPVAAKLATTFENHEKGVTGTSDMLPVKKQLEMIRKFLPNAKKIGILYNTSEVNSEAQIQSFKNQASNYGFEIITQGISQESDVAQAIDTILPKVDCINNLTDNLVVANLPILLEKANAKKIPVFGSEEEQVKNGCLASEGLDYFALGIETGKMAARVLNGENIDNIPIKSIEDSSTFYNQEVANLLGIELTEDIIKGAKKLK